MSSVSNHVQVDILAANVTAQRIGFGLQAILSHRSIFPERIRLYAGVDEMLTDGWPSDSGEVVAAGRAFAQAPRPRQIAILRAAGTVTQSYSLVVDTAVEGTPYRVNVSGEGFAAAETVVTPGADTTTVIASNISIALNAVTGKNYTATPTTNTIAIVADAANGWFSVGISPLAVNDGLMTLFQNHVAPVDTTLATDLNAINQIDGSWYWLHTIFNSEAYVVAIDAAVAALSGPKMYLAQTSSTEDLAASTGTAGPLDVLAATANFRTAGLFHESPSAFLDVGLGAVLATREIGSWTAKGKQVNGVTPSSLTSTQRANLIARSANLYEQAKGLRIIAEGTTALGPSTIRGFIDDVVNLDWVKDDQEARIFSIIASEGKVPRTNTGMVQWESAIRASLEGAVTREIFSDDPEPEIDVPLISEMDDLLPRGVRLDWSAVMAGAAHFVKVTGSVR